MSLEQGFKIVDNALNLAVNDLEERGMPKTSEFRHRHFITKVVGYYNIIDGKDITKLLIL